MTSTLTTSILSDQQDREMNFFKALRQRKMAKRILNEAGFAGNVVEAAQAAVAQRNPVVVERPLKTYFVYYTFEFTESHNSKVKLSQCSNTMIHLVGGVTNWESVLRMERLIKQTQIDDAKYPNARVVVNNFVEVDYVAPPDADETN
jgi:hypothetical protein